MSIKIGIAGAGLSGRLVALGCLTHGWEVHLFDRDQQAGHNSCGWVAAGMLAPFTELESSELLIAQLGLESITQWQLILQQLDDPVSLSQNGTLIVAHPQDRGEQERLLSLVDYKLRGSSLPSLAEISQKVTHHELQQQIPGLSIDLHEGYWIRGEGHIDTHQFYRASTTQLLKQGVRWHEHTPVTQVGAHQIHTEKGVQYFDLVFDCRGLGAKADWPQLRGIRGEVLCLYAPEVHLPCPVRIMHPRYPIYISPRAHHTFIVGATAIESEDISAISAQSMLELLSACYAVHPGFAEARIINSMTQSRPTLADNHPHIAGSDGLLRINGLYRHGYLIGPAVVNEAFAYIEHGVSGLRYPELLDVKKEF